jgi:hypothetical protein
MIWDMYPSEVASRDVVVVIEVRSCRTSANAAIHGAWRSGVEFPHSDTCRFVYGELFHPTRTHIIAPRHPLGCPWVRFVWTGVECAIPIPQCAARCDNRIYPRRCPCVGCTCMCVGVWRYAERCIGVRFSQLSSLL